MSSYLAAHSVYTVPLIGLLSFVARPLLSRGDVFKLSTVSCAALVYAALWANAASSDGSRSLDSVDQYASLGAQAALTLLWSYMCFRFSTPCLNFNTDPTSYRTIRWAPIALLSAVTAAAAAYGATTTAAPPSQGWSAFEPSRVLCWTCPAIALMWYGAGNFFVERITLSAVAAAVPAAYAYWVDRAVVGDGRDAAGGPTAGETLARLATGALVVLAVSSYDKATGLMEAYTLEFPHQLGLNARYARQLFSAFLTAECSMPAVVVRDLEKCFDTLRRISKTMENGTLLFQGGIRLDFLIVYMFGRVTDEMFDNQTDPEKKKRDLQLSKDFVSEMFADRKTPFQVKRKPEAPKIDWAKYESKLNDIELASFRMMARISFYLPAQPFIELFDGYQWDVEGKLIQTEEDLKQYTNMVAGNYGALSVYHIMFRDYNDKYYDLVESGKSNIIIQKAYQMGQGVQMVNISRDIVTDSTPLGRCYIPVEYMDDKKNDVKVLRQDKNPRSLGELKLKKYANKVINLANKFQSESESTLRSLPVEVRGLILAFTDMYRGYINIIQSSPTYPTKARMSKWTQIKIGIYSLYFRSLQYVI